MVLQYKNLKRKLLNDIFVEKNSIKKIKLNYNIDDLCINFNKKLNLNNFSDKINSNFNSENETSNKIIQQYDKTNLKIYTNCEKINDNKFTKTRKSENNNFIKKTKNDYENEIYDDKDIIKNISDVEKNGYYENKKNTNEKIDNIIKKHYEIENYKNISKVKYNKILNFNIIFKLKHF